MFTKSRLQLRRIDHQQILRLHSTLDYQEPTTTMKSDWLYPLLIVAALWVAGSAVCFSFDGELRAAILIPFFIVASIAAVALITRNDRFLFTVLVVALAAKLFASWVYTALPAFQLSDISGLYFDSARQMAGSSINLTDFFSLQQLWGTNLIIAIGACLFSVAGPSLAGAMVLFAVVAFWGQFFFYRAFVLAFPKANRRIAAVLLFLFPSIVYWTSAFGKDALMMLAIGMISYGIARRFDLKGWLTILLGLPLATLVRPHVGAFIAVSLFASYLIADITYGRKIIGLKFLLFPFFVVTCIVIVIYSRNSLELNSVEDARAMSEYSHLHNQVGGSAFGEDESIGVRLIQAPVLMFRPFPWEANNLTALLASLEGLLLLSLTLWRRVGLYRLFLSARSIPLTVFTICFFSIFSVVFSISISNFGLLTRQRVMVLPLVLSLIVAAGSSASLRNIRLKHT
jgi:hypothetical protein